MTSSRSSVDPRAVQVSVDKDHLTVDLANGRRVTVPFVWFPRLLHADAARRKNWQLLGDGQGIRWPWMRTSAWAGSCGAPPLLAQPSARSDMQTGLPGG